MFVTNLLSCKYYNRCLGVYMDALQAEVAALKRLQAETAAELDALLPATGSLNNCHMPSSNFP